ncbi:MAG: DUF86 domain-containing protein [Phycisphaeraceae bacterium]|nr:DUF86 domain-containing protein [Phycisphaeraceae bacterium]
MRAEERDAAMLLDMLDAAEAAVSFAQGKRFEDYRQDPMLRSAIERQIEIIGEAARYVSPSFKARHPEIPWQGMVTQRHLLAHEYDTIRPDRIWHILHAHAPTLIRQLKPLVPAHPVLA